MSVLSQSQSKRGFMCVCVQGVQNFQSMFTPIVRLLWSESVDDFVNLLLFLVV